MQASQQADAMSVQASQQGQRRLIRMNQATQIAQANMQRDEPGRDADMLRGGDAAAGAAGDA